MIAPVRTRATSPAAVSGLMMLLVLWVGTGAARGQDWSLETQAGQIRAVGDSSGLVADTLLVGTRYDHPTGGLRLSTGLPTGASAPLWGALGGWRRAMARPGRGIAFGADFAGNGFLLRDRGGHPLPGPEPPPAPAAPAISGYAIAGQILPGLGYERRGFQVHGRSGVSWYRSRLGQAERDRGVWVSELQAVVTGGASYAVLPAVRHYRDRTRHYTYGGVTGMATRGRATGWGTIGTWMATFDTEVPWAVGGSVRLHQRLAVSASVRREAFDPLYLRAPHTSWALGATLRLAGRSAPPPPPVPAAYTGGRATVHLPVSATRSRPRIAGDFNGWEPAPMERHGDHWSYTVTVEPGVYHYAFVDERDEWFVPERTPGRRVDGMGGHVAVLVVTP
jgi:hypothetical protein